MASAEDDALDETKGGRSLGLLCDLMMVWCVVRYRKKVINIRLSMLEKWYSGELDVV